MFVNIQQDLVNVSHIVHCSPVSGVTQIVLDNGKRYTMPKPMFDETVLPYLPMINRKPVLAQGVIEIQPPEEIQVEPVVITEPQLDELIAQVEEVAPPSNPVVDPQSKPKSRKKAV